MKRRPELASLSRDHHIALAVALVLRSAGEGNADAARRRFVTFMVDHGLDHFAREEAALVPVVGDEEPGHRLITQMLTDHERLRGLWRELRGSHGPADLSLLHAVGERLGAHVRMEERQLFPHLEATLAPVTLRTVAAWLRADPPAVAERSPGVRVTRRFFAAVEAGDVEAMIQVCDPAVHLRPLRLTRTAEYSGHDGVRRWWADLHARGGLPACAIEELQELDADRVVARVSVTLPDAIVRATGVFIAREDRLIEAQGYFSDDDLLGRVGAL